MGLGEEPTRATRKTDMYMPSMTVMNLGDLGLKLPSSMSLCEGFWSFGLLEAVSVEREEDILNHFTIKLFLRMLVTVVSDLDCDFLSIQGINYIHFVFGSDNC